MTTLGYQIAVLTDTDTSPSLAEAGEGYHLPGLGDLEGTLAFRRGWQPVGNETNKHRLNLEKFIGFFLDLGKKYLLKYAYFFFVPYEKVDFQHFPLLELEPIFTLLLFLYNCVFFGKKELLWLLGVIPFNILNCLKKKMFILYPTLPDGVGIEDAKQQLMNIIRRMQPRDVGHFNSWLRAAKFTHDPFSGEWAV